MGLDISKLENVKRAAHGKKTARCPACVAAGADAKGEHLVIYPDGKFGCVAYPDDKAHRKEIFALAGGPPGAGVASKISVNTFNVPDSHVKMDLGRFGRFSTESVRNPRKQEERREEAPTTPPQPTPKPEPRIPPQPSPRPTLRYVDCEDPTLRPYDEAMAHYGCIGGNGVNGATDEEVKAFLGLN